MKTIVMGKKIKRDYEIKVEWDDNGKLKYKPYIKELKPDIQWEEICSYEGEARGCRSESFFTYDSRKHIYLSEDEEVIVEKEIFRADLGDYIQYTNKVLEEDEGGKSVHEEGLKMYIKEFNKERIENDSEAKAYCDLHKLDYATTDYDELMKIINPSKSTICYGHQIDQIGYDKRSFVGFQF